MFRLYQHFNTMGTTNSHEEVPTISDSPPPPSKPDQMNRILSFDPRSPTSEIPRTPIVVEKTPEGALQDPLDPRSPTVGIDRTPLNALQQTKLDLAPNHHHHSDKEEGQMLPDDIHMLGVTGIEDLSLEDFPTSESTRLVPHDEQVMLELKNTKLKKKKQKNSQPKELFPAKTTSALKDVTRSPLSARTIDVNSPANIMQRKQIKDIDKKMTCAQENARSKFIVREKENM
ncbi:hypothetical protein MAR_004491 [Mya arenaria]|uniref:Uncharacterized protein n=1 Tax=Mya arenaria TaxID=6604 RepID=A0ABY7EZX7_MYAAR|nr:hypothetical protein MAR_004491 [Mya arenaria]